LNRVFDNQSDSAVNRVAAENACREDENLSSKNSSNVRMVLLLFVRYGDICCVLSFGRSQSEASLIRDNLARVRSALCSSRYTEYGGVGDDLQRCWQNAPSRTIRNTIAIEPTCSWKEIQSPHRFLLRHHERSSDRCSRILGEELGSSDHNVLQNTSER
jgi:hypothetical protein